MGVRVAVAHIAGRPSAITSSSAIVDVGAPAKALLGKAQRRCAPKARHFPGRSNSRSGALTPRSAVPGFGQTLTP